MSQRLETRSHRIFAASRRGRSHETAGTPREDSFSLASDNESWWFCAVADGAGSRRLAQLGARVATATATDTVRILSAQMSDPISIVEKAALAARKALEATAGDLVCEIEDLACTLLLLLHLQGRVSRTVTTFQIGDGLIATLSSDGTITPIAVADEEPFAGSTHFLTGSRVLKTWDERIRTTELVADGAAETTLMMTDGVADDLIPLDRNGPILLAEIKRISSDPSPDQLLLDEVLSYQKRGSFDDRTLVVGWPSNQVSDALSSDQR
jgi:serine/threonine protein phosphatase PrpC